MKTLFAHVETIFEKFQIKRLIAALIVGWALIVASANGALAADLPANVKADLERVTEQGETGRPRTTGQWQEEKEALEGKPLQAAQRMAKEAADAAGELAELYPQNAKTLTPGVDNGQLPQDN